MGALERFGNIDQSSYERRFEQVIGNSPALESVLEQVERVAPTDSTVLIQGETGTGKELISSWRTKARFFWMKSVIFHPRCNLNCCEYCRNRSSSAWVAHALTKWMFGWWLLRIAISRKW